MGFKLSNTTGRKWEVKYMYIVQIYSYTAIPIQRTRKPQRKKYGTREHKPKFDHKMSSTKAQKREV